MSVRLAQCLNPRRFEEAERAVTLIVYSRMEGTAEEEGVTRK